MFPSTFRRLEVFLAVVEAGSFVAGAERLGISHPSISNHIKALERQVGCTLFLRRKGSVSSLTEQGRRLYERGTRLVQEASFLTPRTIPWHGERKSLLRNLAISRSSRRDAMGTMVR